MFEVSVIISWEGGLEDAPSGVSGLYVGVVTKVTERDNADGVMVLFVGWGRGTSTTLFAFSYSRACLCCSLDLCIHISVVLVPRGCVMGMKKGFGFAHSG